MEEYSLRDVPLKEKKKGFFEGWEESQLEECDSHWNHWFFNTKQKLCERDYLLKNWCKNEEEVWMLWKKDEMEGWGCHCFIPKKVCLFVNRIRVWLTIAHLPYLYLMLAVIWIEWFWLAPFFGYLMDWRINTPHLMQSVSLRNTSCGDWKSSWAEYYSFFFFFH